MITPEIRAEIRRLVLREGWKIETVARRFGVHHSVVRRALRDAEDEPRQPTVSKLEPHKPYIVERLTAHPDLSGTRLFEELKERGYDGGIAVVRRYIAKVRAPRPKKAYLTIETEPGEQAQVDWGSFGRMKVGSAVRPLSAFAMVLRWSRFLYVDFSLDQRGDTFMRMHERAFATFGGVPRKVVYDNLKTVVLHHVGSTVQFNPKFLGFAGHWLFEPVATPVRYPQAKGAVENTIRYIRQSFFYGRQFRDLADVREQVAAWCRDVANIRIHATTRERPADRLLLERPKLHLAPERRYDTDRVEHAIVSKTFRVRLDSNTYSAPPGLVGKTVHVRADDTTVRIVHDGEVVATHERCWDRRQSIEAPEHVDEVLTKRPGAKGPKRRDRIAALCPEAKAYLQQVSRRRISLKSEIRKLERLVVAYGEAEIASAIAQALAARTFGARYVRALADQARFAQGLDEPQPIVTGNTAADTLTVTPHDLEIYDAALEKAQPNKEKPQAEDPDPDIGNDDPEGASE